MAAVKNAPLTASAQEVREFAATQNIPTGLAGRLSRDLIERFNAQSPVPYVEAGYQNAVEVTYQSRNGRQVTRRVVVEAARSLLVAAGEPVGERGPIRHDLLVKVASGQVTA